MVFANIAEVFAGYKINLDVIFYALAGTSLFAVVIRAVLDYIWKYRFASLTIPSTDSRYNWIIVWLKNNGPLKDCQHLSVTSKVNFYSVRSHNLVSFNNSMNYL